MRQHHFALQRALARLGVDLSCYEIPDTPVTWIEKDYRPADATQTALYSGCVYGAPVCLYELQYTTTSASHDVLSTLIDEATVESPVWIRIRELHNRLISRNSPRMVVTYHQCQEAISADNLHLTRSVPAKILRHILQAYTSEGRNRFEYREFMRDEAIVADPLNPNLGIRMQRLSQTLRKKCPAMSLRLEPKGTVFFETRMPIEYGEK